MWKRFASSCRSPFSWLLASPVRLTLLLALCGLASLTLGLWWIYPPAALIAAGILLLAESERMARKLAGAKSASK